MFRSNSPSWKKYNLQLLAECLQHSQPSEHRRGWDQAYKLSSGAAGNLGIATFREPTTFAVPTSSNNSGFLYYAA